MKILWVKAGGLVPLDSGGKIRSYNILRRLADRHEVGLFTFYGEFDNDPHPELRTIFSRVDALPLKLPPARSYQEALWYARSLLSGQPHSIQKFCRPAAKQKLREVVREMAPDVLVCDFIFPAAAFPWNHPTPKVLFTHNVESEIWRRHWQTARNPLWRLVTRQEWKSMERAERCYLGRADHVLTVSEPDREFFSRYVNPAKITVIPTGVDTDFFQPEFGSEKPDRLVFTGSMDWMPNEDGIFYFVEQILPLIRRQVPDVTLCIAGRRPSARLRRLGEAEQRIEVTGAVEDIRPFVHGASVFIVPLRIGGGTRIKIFEAMAMGKPVVSTTIGAEGLPVKTPVHLLVADEPEAFADSVVRLLQSSALRKQMGMAARRLVETGFGWGSIGAQFEAVLEKTVRDKALHVAQ